MSDASEDSVVLASSQGSDERVEDFVPNPQKDLKKAGHRLRAMGDLERDRMRVSTNNERVRTITQKLSKLQQGIQADKSRVRSMYENRVKELDKKVTSHAEQMEEKLYETESQMDSIIEALGQERLARELLDERKSSEMELQNKQLKLELESVKKELGQTVADLQKKIDAFVDQLSSERKLRQDAENKFEAKLGEVTSLSDKIEAQRKGNLELNNTVTNLETKLKQTLNKLDEERGLRCELKSHVDTAIDELAKRVQIELAAERDDREAMEETMLKLIEETCTRVQNGLTSSE